MRKGFIELLLYSVEMSFTKQEYDGNNSFSIANQLECSVLQRGY